MYCSFGFQFQFHHIYRCNSCKTDTGILNFYVALLPRRGPHIASHSVCPSVRPSRYCFCLFYSRTVLRANIQNRKTSVFAYAPASRMYFSARTEGRISYGHLGRTNSCYILQSVDRFSKFFHQQIKQHIFVIKTSNTPCETLLIEIARIQSVTCVSLNWL